MQLSMVFPADMLLLRSWHFKYKYLRIVPLVVRQTSWLRFLII